MKALVLINAHAGTVMQIGVDSIAETARAQLDAAGWTGEIIKESCGALIDAAKRADDIDAVLCAGGDGTQAAIAGAILGRNIALLPLPCGTVNLFCRDLGLPMDIEEAMATGLAGSPSIVDVGLVNGDVFVNNVVFGAYAELADAREDMRHAENFEDASFALSKVADTLLHSETARYMVDLDGDRQSFTSNTLIVSNNAFSESIDLLPRRAILDKGFLAVYLAQALDGRDFAARLLEFATGGADNSESVAHYDCQRCVISSRDNPVHYTVDGDPKESETPIVFEIRRKGLKVLAPVLTNAEGDKPE